MENINQKIRAVFERNPRGATLAQLEFELCANSRSDRAAIREALEKSPGFVQVRTSKTPGRNVFAFSVVAQVASELSKAGPQLVAAGRGA